MRAVITSRENNPIALRASMVKDSTQKFDFVWKPYALELGTTLSSVAYETDQGNVTFSGNSVTDGTASVVVVPSTEGSKLVKMTATMADASTVIRYALLTVKNPDLFSGEVADIWGVA